MKELSLVEMSEIQGGGDFLNGLCGGLGVGFGLLGGLQTAAYFGVIAAATLPVSGAVIGGVGAAAGIACGLAVFL